MFRLPWKWDSFESSESKKYQLWTICKSLTLSIVTHGNTHFLNWFILYILNLHWVYSQHWSNKAIGRPDWFHASWQVCFCVIIHATGVCLEGMPFIQEIKLQFIPSFGGLVSGFDCNTKDLWQYTLKWCRQVDQSIWVGQHSHESGPNNMVYYGM